MNFNLKKYLPSVLELSAGVAFIMAVLLAMILPKQDWSGVVLPFIPLAVCFFALYAVGSAYMRSLKARLDKATNETRLRVTVNSVNVAEIGEKQYLQIQLDTLNDKRLLVAQVLDLCRFAIKAIVHAMGKAPHYAFWAFVLLAATDARGTLGLLHSFATVEEKNLYVWLHCLAEVFGLLLLIDFGVTSMLNPNMFSDLNTFEKAEIRAVRKLFKIESKTGVRVIDPSDQ